MSRLRRRLARLSREVPQTPEAMAQGEAKSVQQRTLLENVRRMGELRVSDAMVPRADVVGVELGTSLAAAQETFRACGHSRLPVFVETLDDPIGFLHVKDLFMAYGFGCEAEASEFSAERYLRSLLTVPPSMPCGALLQKMQAQRIHMALVIDEYGGVDGLVTIEDLLELIVGDITDEHDTEATSDWAQDADGSYVVDARAYLDAFEEAVGVRLLGDDDEVDTIGGLIFTLCNRIPTRGEVIVHPEGHEFQILDVEPRRVKRVRIMLSRGNTGEEERASPQPMPEAAQ